jgi:hypothetical protein
MIHKGPFSRHQRPQRKIPELLVCLRKMKYFV